MSALHLSFKLGKKFLLPALLIWASFTLLPTTPARAQLNAGDVTSVFTISDTEAVSGDIIFTDDGRGFHRTTTEYDGRIFGVLLNKGQPLLTLRRVDDLGQPVVRNGVVEVNVTTISGEINPGDYITSSEIPGKGEKATQSGYVLGTALTGLGANDGQQIDYTPKGQTTSKKISSGKITVALKTEYTNISTTESVVRLFDSFNSTLAAYLRDPQKFSQVLKIVSGAAAIIIGFAVGLVTFSRSIPKSIEAIGRNPLASKTILFSIILNILFTIISASVGVVAAIVILKI